MNSDKKKRLIIPVATLMVAIVMMAGVGYAAISSTFTVDRNTTAGGELEVSVGIDGTSNKILNDKTLYKYYNIHEIAHFEITVGNAYAYHFLNYSFESIQVKISNFTN